MTKVLFVDDEPMVLSGLRRQLRSLRKELEMTFVNSGEEALQSMAVSHFDIIVSDMRMPGMDGIQLLQQVGERYPDTIRFALSGYADMEMALRSTGVVHQFLTKPCSAEDLRTTIEHAAGMRRLMENETLIRYVTGLKNLPSLPRLYTDVIREINSPDGSLARVGEIIAQDIAMSAKILQLVNSAFFGVPQHVSDLPQAVSLLGIDIIKSLVLSIGVFSRFEQFDVEQQTLQRLWQHSLAAGSLAREIAIREGQDLKFQGDALMAGTLHDIGKLIFISSDPALYHQAQEMAAADGTPVWEAEQALFHCAHAEAGAYLLGLWGLPCQIVQAVANHHHPERNGDNCFSVLTACYVANQMLRNAAEGDQPSGLADLDASYLSGLELSDHVSCWQEAFEQMRQVQ